MQNKNFEKTFMKKEEKIKKENETVTSRKNYSEFSYFRVFDFARQPKSKTRIQKSQKKISEISEISEFSTWPICQLVI